MAEISIADLLDYWLFLAEGQKGLTTANDAYLAAVVAENEEFAS